MHTYIHTTIPLHSIPYHYITLHWFTLHYITLDYIGLDYITVHHITLHTHYVLKPQLRICGVPWVSDPGSLRVSSRGATRAPASAVPRNSNWPEGHAPFAGPGCPGVEALAREGEEPRWEGLYPLVNLYIAVEYHHFEKTHYKRRKFNGYMKLPEGNPRYVG